MAKKESIDDIKAASNETIEAMILICRAVLALKGQKAEVLANILGITKDQFSGFMAQRISSGNIKERYYKIARGGKEHFIKHDFANGPKRKLMEYIYSELPPEKSPAAVNYNGQSVVTNTEVLSQLSPFKEDAFVRSKVLPNLFGLNALVRIANEPVEDGKGGIERGWSLSILNFVPDYIQRSAHHAVFKLKQAGLSKHSSRLNIEGRIICQDDRFVFTGVESSQKRPVLLSIHHSEDEVSLFCSKPTAKTEKTSHALPSIMLGVSSNKAQFAGKAKLFKIHGSLLHENKLGDELSHAEFKELYIKTNQLAGVMRTNKLIANLKELGIFITQKELQGFATECISQPLYK